MSNSRHFDKGGVDPVGLEACHSGSLEITAHLGNSSSTPLNARILQIDPQRDVALLRIKERGLRPLKASFKSPDPGDELLSLGFPLAHRGSAVSVTGTLVTKDGLGGLWIAKLATVPGFSGAPVLNSKGEAVGYVVGGLPELGATVRPLKEVRDVLENAQN